MLSSEQAIQKALERFEAADDDSGDEQLEFLIETAYRAREIYVKLYASRLLANAPQQEQDMPFKTMGEFISEQASSSEM